MKDPKREFGELALNAGFKIQTTEQSVSHTEFDTPPPTDDHHAWYEPVTGQTRYRIPSRTIHFLLIIIVWNGKVGRNVAVPGNSLTSL